MVGASRDRVSCLTPSAPTRRGKHTSATACHASTLLCGTHCALRVASARQPLLHQLRRKLVGRRVLGRLCGTRTRTRVCAADRRRVGRAGPGCGRSAGTRHGMAMFFQTLPDRCGVGIFAHRARLTQRAGPTRRECRPFAARVYLMCSCAVPPASVPCARVRLGRDSPSQTPAESSANLPA